MTGKLKKYTLILRKEDGTVLRYEFGSWLKMRLKLREARLDKETCYTDWTILKEVFIKKDKELVK